MMEKSWNYDADCESAIESDFSKGIKRAVLSKVEAKISEIAERDILPKVGDFIENLVLQETNSWGEKKREPISFIEYLVRRAENYIREEVNYEGVSEAHAKAKGNSWYQSGKQTRLAYMVDRHIKHNIRVAMTDAVQNLNDTIVPALADTCRMKLAELSTILKVSCETKSK
jgi:hypothetical protein